MREERTKGQLEAIFGPMFSGKTGELIDQMERQEIAGRNAILFKPSIDNRYSVADVVTHSGKAVPAHCVDRENPMEILATLSDIESKDGDKDVVCIDEAQFFGNEIIDVVEKLLALGKDVIVAGLPTDFKDDGFGPMPLLIAKADKKVVKTAVCTYPFADGKRCGEDATKTQRLINGKPAKRNDPVIQVGGSEAYEARCREHHVVIEDD